MSGLIILLLFAVVVFGTTTNSSDRLEWAMFFVYFGLFVVITAGLLTGFGALLDLLR